MRYKAKLEKLHSSLRNTDNKKISWSMGGDDIAVDKKDATTPKDSSPLI